jgi:hypothetical protein
MDGHRDHAAAQPDPHLVHQPGDTERIERDPQVAMEPVFLQSPESVLSIRGVKRVAMHEPLTSLYAVIAIQFARGRRRRKSGARCTGRPRCIASPANGSLRSDEDIEPENADALFWAMSYRCQPQYDLQARPAQGSRSRAARSALTAARPRRC